jgi:protein involved in polysaccharide export with SLBB domain
MLFDMYRRWLIFFTWIFFLSSLSIGYSQNISEIDQQNLMSLDLSTIDISQLTDEQISSYVNRIEQSGLSEEEVEAALLSRGLPESELLKLKERINQISTGKRDFGTGFGKVRTRQPPQKKGDLFIDLKTDPEEEKILEIEKKVFGYSLFNSPNLTFDPSLNIPTPTNYQIGPGDEIIIDVWGASEQAYQQIVSPDGYIIVQNLGPIYLNGLTIEKATQRIKNRLSQIYSGLSPGEGKNPNTFAQVSLGQLRTIKVTVIGEVRTPGTYDLSALATVFNALYMSGGPSINGSFREIELIRENKVYKTLDIYDFLIRGIQKNNIQLEDQDIIRIKPFTNRVEVFGEIKREGIYEIKEEESFLDLIEFCGGFSENAYQGIIKVRRNTGKERRLLDITKNNLGIVHPENGDQVLVNGILDRFENRVQIVGAVYREGEYELTEKLSVLQLIEKAEGLRGDAFLDRGSIFRTNDDFTTQVIPFNLRQMLKGELEDITLIREDLVKIASIYDLKEEFYVTIGGSVREPGNYPFMEKMTVVELLLEAGGLLESADLTAIEVARRRRGSADSPDHDQIAEIFTFSVERDLRIKEGQEQFYLEPFDNVYIRKSPNYEAPIKVKLEGEVKYPGEYILGKKDERISSLIIRAGGLTSEGYIDGATLIRRTEFFEQPSEIEKRYEDLLSIRKQLNEKYSYSEDLSLTESEYLRSQRLADLEEKAEQYMELMDADQSREGVKQRMEMIEDLQERDTLMIPIDLKRYETIGINLREILANPGSKYDIILQEGDIISVPKQLQTVRLRGEFLYPITVRYDNKYNFKDYLAQAGGFTDNAKKSKTYIIYANGSVDRTKRAFIFGNKYPKVQPGSEIIVPRKPDKEGLSAQAWIAISTSVATFVLVVERLIN